MIKSVKGRGGTLGPHVFHRPTKNIFENFWQPVLLRVYAILSSEASKKSEQKDQNFAIFKQTKEADAPLRLNRALDSSECK